MKQLIIVCSLVVFGSNAQAQSAMYHGAWEENSHRKSKTAVTEPNLFTDVETTVDDKVVTLGGLPDVSHSVWAIVTDVNGEQLEQKRISPKENTIDLRKLRKGEMYFLTITYKDKSRKAFVLHI